MTGIDASPDQIQFARAHRSHPTVNFEVADALNLPFGANRFDAAVCGLGLNFIPKPGRALQEMRRHSPQEHYCAYVWDYAVGARFLREFWDAAAVINGEAAMHDQARRFPLCNPGPLKELLAHAGMLGQGTAPNYLASRSESIRQAIRERLQNSLPIDTQEAIELPARAWEVRGRG